MVDCTNCPYNNQQHKACTLFRFHLHQPVDECDLDPAKQPKKDEIPTGE